MMWSRENVVPLKSSPELIMDYTTEVAHEYAQDLDRASSLQELINTLVSWRPLVQDALATVQRWDSIRFNEWTQFLQNAREFNKAELQISSSLQRRGKRRSRKGRKPNVEFLDVLVPPTILKIALVAKQYGVPWGTAYYQMRRAGLIELKNGIVFFTKKVG